MRDHRKYLIRAAVMLGALTLCATISVLASEMAFPGVPMDWGTFLWVFFGFAALAIVICLVQWYRDWYPDCLGD